MPTNRDKAKLAAALLASVGASPSVAKAQTCSVGAGTCTWSAINHNCGKNAFVKVSTATWDAHIEQDGAYGFNADTAPSVYLDYFAPSGTTFTYGSVCRQAYSGTAASCSTATLRQSTTSGNQDVLLSTTGTYGSTLSPWDNLYLHVTTSASYLSFIGCGVINPHASW